MDCNSIACRNPAQDNIMCDNCYVPKYCSVNCKENDAEAHYPWCRPRQYSLKDFIPLKNSKKVIDIGTYGEVQLMQRINTNTQYAIKVIRKSLITDVIPLKVLLREVMIHKTLIHPNIVRLIDHFEDVTKLYFVLEYVEKGSLFDLLRKKIKLSETEACEIFIQTCTGLEYLHSNNILHRDIKPENLLISKTDTIKICDFGWSATSSERRVTFCGTLDYMSPEMLIKVPHTYKIDIWALGILLYEMLHGAPPFRAKNPKEQYSLICNNSYTVGSHVSRSAETLIRSILRLDPESRPSISEILKSDWIQKYSEMRLYPKWKVIDNQLGEGIIKSVTGKIILIVFKTTHVELIESEVFRKFIVLDEHEKVLSEPPEDQSLPPRFDANRMSTQVPSLYKKLGIDSGRATPVNLPSSAKNSRNGSRVNSPMLSPKVSRNFLVTSPQPQDSRPPKSPKNPEEIKKTLPTSKRTIKKDFDEILLSPDPTPKTFTKTIQPKSSFLSKFRRPSPK